MTTLEDKILGVRRENYCSSSEGEEEEDEESCGEGEGKEANGASSEAGLVKEEIRPWKGTSTNTGPKGVLKDWQRYKELETEKRREEERELLKKLSLASSRGPRDEEDDLLDKEDDFLLEYQRRRMQEMLVCTTERLPHFGEVFDLRSGSEFLDAIDREPASTTVVVHIYEPSVPTCRQMNTSLNSLASHYPHVKFCKLLSSAANMSIRFKLEGVPALLVYKGGQIVGNFVRVTDELGDEFYDGDVENLLIEHGLLVDRASLPPLIQPPPSQLEDNDSDLSLE